jgi:hypothetical protein
MFNFNFKININIGKRRARSTKNTLTDKKKPDQKKLEWQLLYRLHVVIWVFVGANSKQ